jgi:hypothetical protein
VVNVSAGALQGNQNPLLTGLTGLAQGLATGYVQGHQLAQQDRLIDLQKEAGQRAAQELGLKQQEFAFGKQQYSEAQQGQAAFSSAMEKIALLGDEHSSDQFVLDHRGGAYGPSNVYGPEQPAASDADLRTQYRSSIIGMIAQHPGMKYLPPQALNDIFHSAQKEATESESMAQRRDEADHFNRMLSDPTGPYKIRKGGAEVQPPEWIHNMLTQQANDLNNKSVDLDSIRQRGTFLTNWFTNENAKGETAFIAASHIKQQMMENPGIHPAAMRAAQAASESVNAGTMPPEEGQRIMNLSLQNQVEIDTPDGKKPVQAGSENYWRGVFNRKAGAEAESSTWRNRYLESEARWRDAQAEYDKSRGVGGANTGVTPRIIQAQIESAYKRLKAFDDKMRASPGQRILSKYTPMSDDELRAAANQEVQGSLQGMGQVMNVGGQQQVGFPLVDPEQNKADSYNSALQELMMSGKK